MSLFSELGRLGPGRREEAHPFDRVPRFQPTRYTRPVEVVTVRGAKDAGFGFGSQEQPPEDGAGRGRSWIGEIPAAMREFVPDVEEPWEVEVAEVLWEVYGQHPLPKELEVRFHAALIDPDEPYEERFPSPGLFQYADMLADDLRQRHQRARDEQPAVRPKAQPRRSTNERKERVRAAAKGATPLDRRGPSKPATPGQATSESPAPDRRWPRESALLGGVLGDTSIEGAVELLGQVHPLELAFPELVVRAFLHRIRETHGDEREVLEDALDVFLVRRDAALRPLAGVAKVLARRLPREPLGLVASGDAFRLVALHGDPECFVGSPGQTFEVGVERRRFRLDEDYRLVVEKPADRDYLRRSCEAPPPSEGCAWLTNALPPATPGAPRVGLRSPSEAQPLVPRPRPGEHGPAQ